LRLFGFGGFGGKTADEGFQMGALAVCFSIVACASIICAAR
jgi:hypothetical protein